MTDTAEAVVQRANEWYEAALLVIAELRSMGLDETFVIEFIDNGQANELIEGMLLRQAKTNTRTKGR